MGRGVWRTQQGGKGQLSTTRMAQIKQPLGGEIRPKIPIQAYNDDRIKGRKTGSKIDFSAKMGSEAAVRSVGPPGVAAREVESGLILREGQEPGDGGVCKGERSGDQTRQKKGRCAKEEGRQGVQEWSRRHRELT